MRRARLAEPHVAQLERFTIQLRAERGHPNDVPSFDPCDGGTAAELLLLLEAPGPKALETGFISINNPDQTAANLYHLLEEAGIRRESVIIWNVVPWYLGTQDKKKIRSATNHDIITAAPYLGALIRRLPNLKACVLLGRKAQLAEPMLGALLDIPVFRSPHPSPVVFNRSPTFREKALASLRQAASTPSQDSTERATSPKWETHHMGTLNSVLDLTGLYTPATNCTVANLGPIPPALLLDMDAQEYDQVPVLTQQDSAIGIISRSALAERAATAGRLTKDDPAIRTTRVQSQLQLGTLLDTFSTDRAALVYDAEQWLGIMTLADLNRHALRGLLYLALATFEERVANLVQETYDDPWTWLGYVSDWDRVVLVGNWEITKRSAVDLGPTHAATITQLLKVLKKDPKLFQYCGFHSRTETEAALGAVPDVRNSVMHPVRPLATSTEDVQRLSKAIRAMQDVLAHLDTQQTGSPNSTR